MKNRYLILIPVLAVSACGGNVKESLGLKKSAPDEFMVVSRPPLSVPPRFNELPTPGSKVNKIDDNNLPLSMKNKTKGQLALLNKANVSTKDSDIRNKLSAKTKEEKAIIEEKKSGWLGWLNPFKKDTDELIDADAEAERLKNVRQEDLKRQAN